MKYSRVTNNRGRRKTWVKFWWVYVVCGNMLLTLRMETSPHKPFAVLPTTNLHEENTSAFSVEPKMYSSREMSSTTIMTSVMAHSVLHLVL